MRLPSLLSPTRSLKVRLTLLTLLVFLGAAAGLALYVERLLNTSIERVLTAQQRDATVALADLIDRQLKERQLALEQIALMAGLREQTPIAMQRLLDDLPVFQNLFSGGTFVIDVRGVAIASYPVSLPRLGVSFADRDYVNQALATGRPYIGRPVMGRVTKAPVVVMANPIRDARGEVVGVVAGVLDLDQPGFLNAFRGKTFGETGSLLLVSARDRMVVTSSDRERMLAQLPPPGNSPVLDSFLGGFEGSTIFVDPRGIEVLASVKRLTTAPWYLAVSLPTDEAFEPAHETLRHALVGIALLALFAAALTWLVMRRQLAPLGEAANRLGRLTPEQLAAGDVPQLAVQRLDEIGILIQSFNGLVDELTRQRRDLARSEVLYSTAFRTSPDAISISRMEDGLFIAVNESFTRMFGWDSLEVRGRPSSALGLWRRPQDRVFLVDTLRKRGRCESFETEFGTRDGRPVLLQMSASMIELDGQPCILAVCHDITARKQAQVQIEQLAFSDPVTGLANRRLFMDRLHQVVVECQREARGAGLLYVDLDDFKSLNDRLGHEQGDQLLRLMATRLLAAVPPGDTVARLAGDEFVVLLKDLDPDPAFALSQARAVGEALLLRVREVAVIAGADYHGSASIGLAMLGPGASTASALLSCADLAMYNAKAAGGDRVVCFDVAMQDTLNARVALEGDLREALKAGQFRLYYQPQLGVDGRLLGAEALVRWQHPVRGMVSPGEFIPVAEDSGLIVDLGRWILGEACRQLAQWRADPRLAGLKVSVNVSSRQFEQADFVSLVLDQVATSGIEPSCLNLELTESLLIDNIEDVTAKMSALGLRGIGFALDDFGTGFSSLSYLKRLPFNELKIDQGFVRAIDVDANDLAIARMIVALGRSLGLAVVAEGVETEAQRSVLAGIGCECFQGYLFSRPLPAVDFAEYARRHAQAAEATVG